MHSPNLWLLKNFTSKWKKKLAKPLTKTRFIALHLYDTIRIGNFYNTTTITSCDVVCISVGHFEMHKCMCNDSKTQGMKKNLSTQYVMYTYMVHYKKNWCVFHISATSSSKVKRYHRHYFNNLFWNSIMLKKAMISIWYFKCYSKLFVRIHLSNAVQLNIHFNLVNIEIFL